MVCYPFMGQSVLDQTQTSTAYKKKYYPFKLKEGRGSPEGNYRGKGGFDIEDIKHTELTEAIWYQRNQRTINKSLSSILINDNIPKTDSNRKTTTVLHVFLKMECNKVQLHMILVYLLASYGASRAGNRLVVQTCLHFLKLQGAQI